ncbi:protein kinase domain-containing protein, partial [Parendozoicomonas haliclonae]
MTHREYVPLKLERLNRTACAQLFSLIVFLSGFTALKLPAALTTYLVVALYPDNVDNNTELPSIPLYKHPWISLTIYPVSADSAHLDTPTLLKKRMPKIALSSGSDTLFYSSPAQNYSEQYMVWKTGFHSSDRKHNPEASQHQILLMSPEQQSGHQSGISQHHAQVETPSSNTIQIGEHRFQTYSSMGKTPFYTLYHESLSVPAPETYDTPEHQSDTSADIIQSLSSITLKTSAEMTQPIPPQQPQRPIIRTPAPRSATTRHVRVVKKETQPKKTLTILDTRTPGIISSSPLSISDKLAHLIPTDSTSPTLEAMSKAGLQSFPMKNFQTIELLKRGSFGSIRQHRGPSSEGIIDIVTKTIDEEHFNALYLKREATILQHLLHPNIVNIFGFNLLKNHETGKYKLQLVLEHIPGIDMLTALNTLSQRFTEPLIKQIISLLTGVVAYLHHNNIAHR